MRIGKFVVVGLLVAAVLSAVALAVDKQGAAKKTDDAPEPTVTVTGVLAATGQGYKVGSRGVSFGPPWYAASSPLVKDRLGKTVTVTGTAEEGDDLSVRTIDGVVYRAKGRPPWAGGPKPTERATSDCKTKAAEGRQGGENRQTGAWPASVGESLRPPLQELGSAARLRSSVGRER